jgi:hypothetical protein
MIGLFKIFSYLACLLIGSVYFILKFVSSLTMFMYVSAFLKNPMYVCVCVCFLSHSDPETVMC